MDLVRLYITVLIFHTCFTKIADAQVSPNLEPGFWIRDTAKSDEFNGSTLDTGKWWTIDPCTVTDDIAHGYNIGGATIFRTQNVSVSNGSLVLKAEYNPDSLDPFHPCVNHHIHPFYSGGVLSPLTNAGPGIGETGNFSFGYYEMRAKLPGYYDADHKPVGYGMGPAFWFYYQYPGIGCIELKDEVDILEPSSVQYYDARTNVAGWHDEDGECNGYKVGQDSMRSPVPLFEDFHSYAVALLPDRIIFYFDDQPFFSADTVNYPGIAHSLKMSPWLAVIMDLGMGGYVVPQPLPSAPFPQFMYIDYFRYYRVNPEFNIETMLFQNSPNPAIHTTDIEYSINTNSKDARITVCDIYGMPAGSFPLHLKGKAKITFSSTLLKPGIYFYSLWIENKKIATKKMVVMR